MMADLIPVEALAHHIAILGKTGSGKSNAAKTLVEAALDRQERVCVLDPTGAWYGLRLTATGKPSRYPVVIFGGQHADLPVGPAHGAAIAEIIGTSATPAVIDTRLMTVGDRTRFFTDFAETLLRKNRGPLTLVIDEAHLFAPQGRVADPQSGKMLHAANNLVSLGRSIGLRVIMLSQRPAKLHKDSLTQVETLVAMRLIAPQDVNAVDAWIGEWAGPAQGREIISSLPSMPTGDAWVWSPEIGVLNRVHFPLARTFDSGRAPTGSEAGPGLAPLDIEGVTARLEQVAADAKANDPATLKTEIAALKRTVASLDKAKIRTPEPAPVVVNQDALDAAREEGRRAGIATGIFIAQDALKALRVDDIPVVRQKAARAAPAPREAPAPVIAADGVTGPQQRILNALTWWQAFGIGAPTNEQVGFIAGYAPGSGNFNNLKGGLRAAGWIDYPVAGRLALTPAGAALALAPTLEITRDAFHAQVRSKLNGPQIRLLDPVLEVYPESLDTSAVAAAAGYAPNSGNFNNLRGSLRTIGLIDYPSSGRVRAADWLFP